MPANPVQFAGRSVEVAELTTRLGSTIAGIPQHSAIMGGRGIGKTSILRKFEQIAYDKNCIVCRVDLHPGIRELEELLLNLHEELRRACIGYYGSLGKQFETIRNFLETYSVTIPVVVGTVGAGTQI